MSDNPDNNGRNPKGRFVVGNAGGPGGWRRKAQKLRRVAQNAVSPEMMAELTRKLARMALEGNLDAAKLLYEQTRGRPNEVPIEFRLSALRTVDDCDNALVRALDRVAKGAIHESTARFVMDAITLHIKTIEARNFEERLGQLEQAAKQAEHNSDRD